MKELDHDATQQVEAMTTILDGLLTALQEQVTERQLCPDCLLQNLTSTLLLNVGLKHLHDDQQESWAAGIQDILEGVRLAHTPELTSNMH